MAHGLATTAGNVSHGIDVAYYRALTRVRKTTHNPKTSETFTLIRGVTLTP